MWPEIIPDDQQFSQHKMVITSIQYGAEYMFHVYSAKMWHFSIKLFYQSAPKGQLLLSPAESSSPTLQYVEEYTREMTNKPPRFMNDSYI